MGNHQEMEKGSISSILSLRSETSSPSHVTETKLEKNGMGMVWGIINDFISSFVQLLGCTSDGETTKMNN